MTMTPTHGQKRLRHLVSGDEGQKDLTVADCYCGWSFTKAGGGQRALRLAKRNLDLHLQRHGALGDDDR